MNADEGTFSLRLRRRGFGGIVVTLVVSTLAGLLFLVGPWGTARSLITIGAADATPDAGTVSPVASPRASGTPRSGGGTDMTELEACLIGRWLHSHEEDTPDARVYRPADYPFPPARGREGFEFRPNGELIYLGIARADGVEESNGRWTVEAPQLVRIDVENERFEPLTLEVISCDEASLKVKR